MHYQDAVYGQATIEEPVLLDLMTSKAFQRLHFILQHGITGFLKITQPITRYQHSVGVMLLTRHLGASLKEQIAALLHDVSHTAFSHVIDHVFGTPTGQSYHELSKQHYLEQSDIPPILARHGYDWHEFITEEAYPILEQPAPALCADRLDYFFRDGIALGLLTAAEATQAISHLQVEHDQIGVLDLQTARWLAYTYLKADELSWSNINALGYYELMAQILQRGLRLRAITERDVWRTDQELWNKLTRFPDEGLQLLLDQLLSPIEFIEDSHQPWRQLTPKIRVLDPLVWVKGEGRRLSELDSTFQQELEGYKQRRQRVLSLGIVFL